MTAVRPGHLLHPDLTPTWCDPVAVARALAGKPVGRTLHHAERLAVATTAHQAGISDKQLGRLLGCSDSTAAKLRWEATACST